MKETTVTCDKCRRTQAEAGHRFREVVVELLFGNSATYDLCADCSSAFHAWLEDIAP